MATRSSVPVKEHPRVLVADGQADSRSALRALFEAEGAEVLEAQNADTALSLAGNQALDLVLLDLQLPGGGGLEVLKQLKRRPLDDFLPVMVVATDNDLEAKVLALRTGADDYMARPVDPSELTARASALLRIKTLQDAVRATKRELERLTITDGLTGLYNHRYFQDRLREEFRRAQRYGDPLTLIMADLDAFKDVNDNHGHQFGDEVLRAVSTALSHSVRETDIVARYGGDEFAIILPQTPMQGAMTVAERVWKGMGTVKVKNAESEAHMTASIGVSFFPNKNITSPEILLRVADEALYHAKRGGRNKICVYNEAAWVFPPQQAAEAQKN